MKVLIAFLVLFPGVLCGQAGAAELARRTYLGVQFDLSDHSGPGLRVSGVAAGSTAASAGLRVDDRLTSVGTIDMLDSYAELRDTLARTPPGERLPLRWYRGANHVFRAAPPLGVLPTESVPGSRTRYDAVTVDGHLQRLILSEPESGGSGLIFYLQGRGCESLDYWQDTDDPVKHLIDGWAAAGYATARLEKRGVGDSTGPPCPALDDDSEHRAFLAAIGRLSALGFTGRIHLFGRSTGGLMAARVATGAVATVMVLGAPAEPERIWRQVWQPVLVLRGEFDWTTDRSQQEHIARLTGGRLQSLAGLGPDLLRYPSLREAEAAPGTGVFDPAVVDATVTWLNVVAGDSRTDR